MLLLLDELAADLAAIVGTRLRISLLVSAYVLHYRIHVLFTIIFAPSDEPWRRSSPIHHLSMVIHLTLVDSMCSASQLLHLPAH